MRLVFLAPLLLSLIVLTHTLPSEDKTSSSLTKRGQHPPPIKPPPGAPKPEPVPEDVKTWLEGNNLDLPAPANSTEGWIWNLSFDMDIEDFEAHRKQQDIPELTAFTWSKDHCTGAPDKPLGFDFKLACNRHDFMYHAWGYVCRLDHDHRKSADKVFLRDMKEKCGKNVFCKSTAKIYYKAVRKFHGSTGLCGKDKWWN